MNPGPALTRAGQRAGMTSASDGFRTTCTLFPGIGSRGAVSIPKSAHSTIGPSTSNMRRVSWGALQAACLILTGQVQAWRDARRLTLAYQSSQRHLLTVAEAAGQTTWTNIEGCVRPSVALIAEAVLLGRHSTLQRDWATLTECVKRAASLPLTPTELARISHLPDVQEAMFRVVDGVYYTHKRVEADRGCVTATVQDPGTFPHTPLLFGEAPRPIPHGGTGARDSASVLARRAARGVRALLVGPTGVGKTELVKAVCRDLDRPLFAIKGRIGLEDRDLVGYFAPCGGGFTWVDGTIARAMRRAMSGEAVILAIDELMRMEEFHRGVFIGLTDTYTQDELKLLLGRDLPVGRYYTLELPGKTDEEGRPEILYAREDHLSLIFTTNAGSQYTQQGSLDPALKRRMQITLFVDQPDQAKCMAVYEPVAGTAAAIVVTALELATRDMTEAKGQLLSQPLNFGTGVNYLTEVKDLMDCGLALEAALTEALETTVIPFCCPLTEDGGIDLAAAKSLQTTLERLLRHTAAQRARAA